MSRELYEVIALAARYLFVFLGIVIVLRSFLWLRKDRVEKHRRLKSLPDAGMIGELVVLRGSRDLPEGMSVPVPREGVLGYVRGCDMVIPCSGVKKRHLDLRFEDGNGLLVIPRSGCEASVDGHMLDCRSRFDRYPMFHGSVLEVGDAVLRLRLFSGVSAERSAMFAQDPSPVPVPPVCIPNAYQAGPGMMPASVPDSATVPYPTPERQVFTGSAFPCEPGNPEVTSAPAAVSPDTASRKRARRSDKWKEDPCE